MSRNDISVPATETFELIEVLTRNLKVFLSDPEKTNEEYEEVLKSTLKHFIERCQR